MEAKPALSEDEIDSLMGSAETESTSGRVDESSVNRYDFLGREKKLFGQMPGLRELNEKVCSDLAKLVSDNLRLAFEVGLDEVDIRDGESLEACFSEDAIISMAKLDPLQGFSLVEVPTALLSYITENYFGGTSLASDSSAKRPYSRSEVRIQTRLVSLFFAAIESGWASPTIGSSNSATSEARINRTRTVTIGEPKIGAAIIKAPMRRKISIKVCR